LEAFAVEWRPTDAPRTSFKVDSTKLKVALPVKARQSALTDVVCQEIGIILVPALDEYEREQAA
jgi:hypothetical protein